DGVYDRFVPGFGGLALGSPATRWRGMPGGGGVLCPGPGVQVPWSGLWGGSRPARNVWGPGCVVQSSARRGSTWLVAAALRVVGMVGGPRVLDMGSRVRLSRACNARV